MSDFDNNDRQNEQEIREISGEHSRTADEAQAKEAASKAAAQPKIIDIFSNADQKPRLTNQNPLEAEQPHRTALPDNAIAGEKTAATMQAELLMDGAAAETGAPEQASEQQPVVALSPEYDAETQFAGEVMGEEDAFRDIAPIEDINTIDISLEPETAPETEKKAQPAAEDIPRENPEPSSVPSLDSQTDGIVAKVPVYRPEEPDNILNVKAGKFSEVVGREYEAYLHSKIPSVISHVIRPKPSAVTEEESSHTDSSSAQEKILSAVVGFFSKDDPDSDVKEEQGAPVEDYTGDADEKSIKFELNANIRKLFFRGLISGIIALVAVILTMITRIIPDGIISAIPVAPAAYAVFNLLLVGSAVVLNRVSMISGLSPLLRFKGNSDTAVAAAGAAAVLHAFSSFFYQLGDMSTFRVNYYCAIVLLAFFANNAGKLLLVLRVRDNFGFVASKAPKYAAKIYTNEDVANKMLSGTLSEKNLIVYQHKTKFASNFLKISYAPDPSEDLASRLAPITTVAAVATALLCGIIRLSYAEAFGALSLVTALAIPVSTLLAVNIPVRKLCKTLTGYGAMIAGYPSIKQFCDSTAIMIDANELFPAASIDLEGIKTFDEFNVDETLLCGIAVLKEAQNPIANAFASVVSETKETLPEVESVLYEDELGIVGWINGERILVGSRALLEKYGVAIPEEDYEGQYTTNGKQITYLSRAGSLAAILVTRYHADPELKSEMQRAEANGISFLIRTTDYNITDELVASLYNVFYRSLRVLPTGLGNALKEARSVTEEQSRSYLITRGKAAGMARAVSGCVRIKQNISLAIVIQLIAVVLGMLLSVPLTLYAGVGVMGAAEVLIYTVFWAVAAIIAPAIQKP